MPLQSDNLRRDVSDTPAASLRLAYIVSRFPDVSEAFIRYELEEIAGITGGVDVFPLVAGAGKPDRVLIARNIGVFAPSADFAFLRTPGFGGITAKAVVPLFRMLTVAPRETLKCLVLLPRILTIGRRASALGTTHIHAHFAALPAYAAAIIYRMFGIPFSVTAHAYDLRCRPLLMRWKMRCAKFGVVVSDYSAVKAAALTAGLHDLRWHVNRNGIPLDVFQQIDRTRGETLPLRILSVGRLVPKKGFADLLMACVILRAAGVVFNCRIIGDGPLRKRLFRLAGRLGIAEYVTFAGSLHGEALLREYAESDVFALACRAAPDGETDTLPVVLTEAMAAGLPDVSTRLAAIPELIEDGFNGLLAEPGDPASLARALGRVLVDPGLRASMAQHARPLVARDYNVRNTASSLLRLICRASAAQSHSGGIHANKRASSVMGPGNGRRSNHDRHTGKA